MWPFKKPVREAPPKLEFTERQTSPYAEDNVTIMHTGNVVRGTIMRTKYGTYKVELCGHKAEYMSIVTAEDSINKKWEHLNAVSRIAIK
jgi:hypothetical protein